MGLLASAFLIVFAAGALFVLARRFGVAEMSSAVLAATGSAFVVAALLVSRESPPPQPAPVAQAPAAPEGTPKPEFTFPLGKARSLKLGDAGRGSIDVVTLNPPEAGRYDNDRKTIDAKRSSTIIMQGWAVDQAQGQAGGGALALVDGRIVASARYGADRNDVATYLKIPGYRFSGYSVAVAAGTISPGAHQIRVATVSPDGKRYEPFGPVITLTVRP